MPTITYVPQEGDPSHTSWHGHRFEANVPREITHPALLAQAAGNPWFKVEGNSPGLPSVPSHGLPPMSGSEDEAPGTVVPQAPKPQGGRPPNPTTPTEYRLWLNRWLAKARSRDEIDDRWTREEGLREACGVGSEDLALIDTVMQPRRHELRAIEKAAEVK